MNEINEINLTDQTKSKPNKITEIENCFHQEINHRKSCSKNWANMLLQIYYIDKILIVLSATSSGVCIILSASVVGAPIGLASASFTLELTLP